MSQYLHIFVRKNETFIPILIANRSQSLYEVLSAHHCPYAAITELTASRISDAINEADERIEQRELQITRIEETLSLIPSFNNTVEEKMDMIYEAQREKDELMEEMAQYKAAKEQLNFLTDIYYELREAKEYEEDGGPNNVSFGLYYGVECGYAVTVNDIQ